MKRILVIFSVLIAFSVMMSSCSIPEKDDVGVPTESVDAPDSTEAINEVPNETENGADSKETADDSTLSEGEPEEEIPVDNTNSDSSKTEYISDEHAVAEYAEIMNELAENDSVYVEARGTELAMVYVFDEEYDSEMLEIMSPLLEQEMATEDFYGTYLEIKSELPEISALTVEFVTTDGTVVYSNRYDDNYGIAPVNEITEMQDVTEEDSTDVQIVALVVDYIKESGVLDSANIENVAEFDVYADGTKICMEIKLFDEVAEAATEQDYEELNALIEESIDYREFKSLCPALSGIDVYIVDDKGEILAVYRLN